MESKGDSMEVDALDKVKGKGAKRDVEHEQGERSKDNLCCQRGQPGHRCSDKTSLHTSSAQSTLPMLYNPCLLRRCFAISAPCLYNTTTDNHHPRCHVQVIQHLARSLHLSLSHGRLAQRHQCLQQARFCTLCDALDGVRGRHQSRLLFVVRSSVIVGFFSCVLWSEHLSLVGVPRNLLAAERTEERSANLPT